MPATAQRKPGLAPIELEVRSDFQKGIQKCFLNQRLTVIKTVADPKHFSKLHAIDFRDRSNENCTAVVDAL